MTKVEEIVREAKKGKGKLDEVLERRKDMQATALEESMVDRMIEEDRRRAAEERSKRRKIESGVSESESTMTSLLAFLTQQGVKGEDAAKFIKALDEETIMKLNMLSASPQGQNALMPLLLFSRQPQTNLKDLSDISKGYVDTAVKLVETMRPPERGEKEGPEGAFLTLFSKTLDELKETRMGLLQNQISNIEKKIEETRFSPRDYIKSLREDAEAIGLGRREGVSDETQLKIAEIQTHTQLELEKMRMEREDRLLQMQGEQAKWNAIRETFSPMLAVGAQPIAEALRNVGRKVGAQVQKSPSAPGAPPVPGPSISIPCPQCGSTLGPFQPPFPEAVKCQSCGLEKTFMELMTPPGQRPPGQPAGRSRLRPKYG